MPDSTLVPVFFPKTLETSHCAVPEIIAHPRLQAQKHSFRLRYSVPAFYRLGRARSLHLQPYKRRAHNLEKINRGYYEIDFETTFHLGSVRELQPYPSGVSSCGRLVPHPPSQVIQPLRAILTIKHQEQEQEHESSAHAHDSWEGGGWGEG